MASSSQPNTQPHDENGSYSALLFFGALAGAQQPLRNVPERFRKGHEEFYRSRVVTIGPYHDFDLHLRSAGIKLLYVGAFADRYSWGIKFMFFMGWMIRTSKDVDILIGTGIISSMLGRNTDLVALFDRISKMGWPHVYFDLCQELNDYCKSNPWHRWKATLKRDYFDTPWKIASTIAAVILLLLTLMQTVCSFLSLKP